MELLERRGAIVSFHDPFLAEIPRTREHAQFAGRRSTALSAAAVAALDAAIICTDHDPVDYRCSSRSARSSSIPATPAPSWIGWRECGEGVRGA